MMNVQTSSTLNVTPEARSESESQVDISKLLSSIRRGRRLIVTWVLCLLALGILYLVVAVPKYTSTAQIIIDTQTSQAMQKQDVIDASTIDTSLVDSQVEIIGSAANATSVVRALNLTQDPEFVGPATDVVGSVLGWIGDRVRQVMALFGSSPPRDNAEERAVAAFQKNLTVKRTGLTYVINISFSSQSPDKSALIANAVGDAYLKGVLDAKYEATKRTSEWLQSRIGAIRAQATDADRAVETFKSVSGIVDTNRGLMSEQQLGELNSQLATAQAATAEAQARVERARDIAKNALKTTTTSEALNNTVISRLRAQYLDLSARRGDLAGRFGPGHATVVKLDQQMKLIEKSIQDQVKQIVDADVSDYEIALARERSLRASLDKLVSKSDVSGIAQVKLKDLESSADTYRTIYNSYLQKFQEATQRESFPISDARVITPAVAPLQKSSPKSLIVLGGGLVVGLFLGIGNIFVREALDDSYLHLDSLTLDTGLPCLGILPNVAKLAPVPGNKNWAQTSLKPGKDIAPFIGGPDCYVLSFPFSRFTETMRNIKVSLDAAKVKVIAITSSLPGEGKTTMSTNLSQLLASGGARTLLIDADFTRRSLTDRMVNKPSVGLLEALQSEDPFNGGFIQSTPLGLDILACPSGEIIRNRPELLGSKAFADLLDKARSTYDYVVVDIAPVLPVVDARVAAHVVDAFLMVVAWHETSRKVTKEALNTEGVGNRVLGTILNKVDSSALKELESYRGKAFAKYYM